MGILDMAEEAAGAFAADKALEAVDPNAGFLAKAAAAVAGYEGVSAVKEHFAADGSAAPADAAPTDDTVQPTDDGSDQNT